MRYKINIAHKKIYSTSQIILVNYEFKQTNGYAAYDYIRGTKWVQEGSDWSCAYRMSAYIDDITTENIVESLSNESMRILCQKLAEEWHTYMDYYTMKLQLKNFGSNIYYSMGKSGVVGIGVCSGILDIRVSNINNSIVNYVTDIKYNNELLNYPKIIKDSLKKYSFSEVINLSTKLNPSLISDAINTDDGQLVLAGLISVDQDDVF